MSYFAKRPVLNNNSNSHLSKIVWVFGLFYREKNELVINISCWWNFLIFAFCWLNFQRVSEWRWLITVSWRCAIMKSGGKWNQTRSAAFIKRHRGFGLKAAIAFRGLVLWWKPVTNNIKQQTVKNSKKNTHKIF